MRERNHVGDQAAGLRRMLRAPVLRVVPVMGGRDAAQRAGTIVNLATAAAMDRNEVIVLDQSKGDVARALGLKARFELMHLLDGDMEFGEVALNGPQGVRVLPAARGLAVLAEQGGQASALFSAFTRIERPADLILINADDATTVPALMPVTDGELLLLASPAADAITGAYALIKQLVRTSGLASYRMLVGDVVDPGDAQAVAQNMAAVTRRFLSARMTYGGFIPRDQPLRQAERAGIPVVCSAPQSASAQAYRRIAAGMPDWHSFEIGGERAADMSIRTAARI
jgi:flagellar biosynthesis protein FlhG